MSDVIKKFFKDQMSFKNAGEVADEIRQRRKGITPKQVEEVAKGIRKKICECRHPVVNKAMDWGYLKGRTDYARKLKKTVEDLLVNNVKSLEDLKRLEEGIKRFKEGMLEKGKEIVKDKEKGLRPWHIPGSVAREEARNLYFGELYDEHALFQLSTRLMNSTCIGRSMGVYFANEELRKDLKQELLRKFGLSHVLDENLSELHIYRGVEDRKPYIVFMKFLLWLYESYEAETVPNKKGRLRRMLDLLKETEGVIYFTPSKEKEEYSTIPLPRLDLLFSNWIDVKERGEALKRMRDSLYFFMGNVMKNARRKKERKAAQNKLDLLATYCDMFCAQLLRSGFISHEPIRRMVDLAIELSDRYNVPTSLSFAKEISSL